MANSTEFYFCFLYVAKNWHKHDAQRTPIIPHTSKRTSTIVQTDHICSNSATQSIYLYDYHIQLINSPKIRSNNNMSSAFWKKGKEEGISLCNVELAAVKLSSSRIHSSYGQVVKVYVTAIQNNNVILSHCSSGRPLFEVDDLFTYKWALFNGKLGATVLNILFVTF